MFKALWLHNVITLSFSIGVNIFWKHLEEHFYEKKDIYGNKDLTYASKAILFTEKARKEINLLPEYYREFYTKRLVQMLMENLKPPEENIEN
jgi:tRNA wybutosine-synthesizing protein 5